LYGRRNGESKRRVARILMLLDEDIQRLLYNRSVAADRFYIRLLLQIFNISVSNPNPKKNSDTLLTLSKHDIRSQFFAMKTRKNDNPIN
jgi:hypothetical protein